MKYARLNDHNPIARDLKTIYQLVTEEEALQALDDLANDRTRSTRK